MWKLPAALLVVMMAACCLGQVRAAPLPAPGSPERLLDWRWLARAPEGSRVTLSGKEELEARDGKFVLLALTGAGVLDHVILRDGEASLSLVADGRPLWEGKMGSLATSPEGTAPLFPGPIFSAGASFYHLLAPVGFRSSLLVLTDKADLWRYVSYRSFPDPAAVTPADPDPTGTYAQGLQAAAAAWKAPTDVYNSTVTPPAREERRAFTAPAGGRATALDLTDAGEITHLEFHLIPPLTGSLRELVVEVYYDGAAEPSLRLPVTDLAGMPHPWPNGRWDFLSGTLASGLRYPWQEPSRVDHPEAQVYCNLPLPFARGLRVDLVNRSDQRMFAGWVRAVVAPAPEGAGVGRLCGTRLVVPLTGEGTAPLITLPGPGQIVGLGLFTTGSAVYPPAQLKGASWVALDGAAPLRSVGLVPLWMAGGYGGPYMLAPVWNHARLEPGYVGVRRDFVADPLPFEREAAFGYDPGEDCTGAPTSATVIALWYRYGDAPYAAPALPAHAEALPYVTHVKPERVAPVKGAIQVAALEAEDLANWATVQGGEVAVAEDPDHNYHASGGKYLTIRADKIGDYVDFLLSFPASRYFALGQVCLSGPVGGYTHTNFELGFLSREAAQQPPIMPRPGTDFTYSVLGGAPTNLGAFIIRNKGYRRDVVDHYAPQLNPAPEGEGVMRFVRRGPGATMIRFDQFWLYQPPPTLPGWHEFEEGLLPACGGDLTASLPLTGRVEWSGWGALKLAGTEGGQAMLSALAVSEVGEPQELHLSGSLAPGSGTWQVAVAGSTTPPVTLAPGQEANKVQEWILPVAGLSLPGPVGLEITYSLPVNADKSTPPKESQLFLDAWTVK